MISDVKEWANTIFGNSKLGDKRRTQRLIKMASEMGHNIGKSVLKSSVNDASVEGNYRLIRNEKITAEPIAESGFEATAQDANKYDLLLALEDTTTLSYKRGKLKRLGDISNTQDAKITGFLAHSVLLYAPEEEHTVGLIAQNRWMREEENFGCRKNCQKRPYEDKESYKWEQASKDVAKRLGDKQQDVISVCDRECDIIEYLSFKQEHNQRFVARATFNRPLEDKEERLFDFVRAQKAQGQYTLEVPQRGGRKARTAELSVRYSAVDVLAPERKRKDISPLNLYAVICTEIGESVPKKDKLEWKLLTTEPVTSFEQALQVIKYYEARWKVELFHKVWKTEGTNVEELKMHEFESLEKVAVIQAFIACRLMQLKDMGDSKVGDNAPCTLCLTELQWKLLHKVTKKGQPIPKEVPTIRWAYHAIARLAGWNDSKQTGRVGWKTLHEGLDKLDTMQMMYESMSVEI